LIATAQYWTETVCWRCGGAADPRCAFKANLVAARSRGLDPLGHEVKGTRQEARIRVLVPRCRSCRARSWMDTATFLLCAAMGAALFDGTWWWTGPGSGREPPFVVVDEQLTMWLLCFAGVFAGALFAVVPISRRRQPDTRGYNDFPPIAALRALGWDWPSTAD
jgi:hypothetical protein